MNDFLAEASNFQDMPIKFSPAKLFPDMVGPWALCPLCQGHGGWNLGLNAYGPGRHFQAFCRQCWGWGWVKADSKDVKCVHTFKEIAPDQPYRCWHTIQCANCGETRSYDSSD